MGFASVFPCNIKVLRSYDAHGLEVFATMFLKNGSNPPIWNSLQGIPIGFAWLILESRRLTRRCRFFYQAVLEGDLGRPQGVTLPPLEMTPRINQWWFQGF